MTYSVRFSRLGLIIIFWFGRGGSTCNVLWQLVSAAHMIGLFDFGKNVRRGSVVSRFLRTIFEKHFIRPLLGLQLFAGVAMLGPLSLVQEESVELAYPGIGISPVVISAVVVDPVKTERTAMQNPAAEFIGVSTYFRAGHAGYDFRAPLRSGIYPVTDGVVKAIVHSNTGYGRRVIVEHAEGFESLYAHMGLIEVEEGQKVDRSTRLGEVGLTGWTTGPHIHFELYLDGVPVNPKYYLDLELLPAIQ